MNTRAGLIRNNLMADLQALVERVGILIRSQPPGVDVDISSATALQDLLRAAKGEVPNAILEDPDAARV